MKIELIGLMEMVLCVGVGLGRERVCNIIHASNYKTGRLDGRPEAELFLDVANEKNLYFYFHTVIILPENARTFYFRTDI